MRKCFTDFSSDGGSFSAEAPSIQVTLVDKDQRANSSLDKIIHLQLFSERLDSLSTSGAVADLKILSNNGNNFVIV